MEIRTVPDLAQRALQSDGVIQGLRVAAAQEQALAKLAVTAQAAARPQNPAAGNAVGSVLDLTA